MTEWSCFKGKTFNIAIIQVHAPITNGKEGEIEHIYEDLEDLPEQTPKTDVLYIIEDWNAKVGSQEIPGVIGKFDLGVQKKQGKG